MNLTQEKIILADQVQASTKNSMIKYINHAKIDKNGGDILKFFVQDTLRFYLSNSENFYQQIWKRYDIDDLLFQIDEN